MSLVIKTKDVEASSTYFGTVNGSLLCTTNREPRVRFFNPRSNSGPVVCFEAHEGNRPVKIGFMQGSKFITTGFTKQSKREFPKWWTYSLGVNQASHMNGTQVMIATMLKGATSSKAGQAGICKHGCQTGRLLVCERQQKSPYKVRYIMEF